MLELPDAWTWDFWLVDNGAEYHVFYLRASRALLDPGRRHLRASVGHACSTDLRSWTVLPDALVASDSPAWDDLAVWTGSITDDPAGAGWRFFYTAINRAERGLVQRIGSATSTDLISWHRDESMPALTADPRWYEQLDHAAWPEEAWRDPWVYPDPGGVGWHMLITARANSGPYDDRAVIGHATSPDLVHWTVDAPLSEPGAGFGQLEVPQVAVIYDQPVLIFSCLQPEMAERRRNGNGSGSGGVWIAPSQSLTGPFDIHAAQRLTDETYYAGRVIRDRTGQWMFLAFRHRSADGSFVGGLIDPIPFQQADEPGLLPSLRM